MCNTEYTNILCRPTVDIRYYERQGAEARKSEAAPCSASMFIDGAGEGAEQADGV